MSKEHFQSIQNIIEQLEELGFTDATDQVKPHYDPYTYLCTLERPAPEREKGPIYCRTLDDLLAVLEEVKPPSLSKQVWFCEQCRLIGINFHGKRAGAIEVVESVGQSHREDSPGCPYGAKDLRIINHNLITSRDALLRESTIPNWAKDRIAKLLFEERESSS